jgi:hypothetical protein
LGLLIVTDEDEKRVVVDGQQRLTTLTLLANAIRRLAQSMGKNLIADSMRDLFLFHLDYESERRSPRIQSTASRDRATLSYLLLGGDRPADPNKLLLEAQKVLDESLLDDVNGPEADSKLARWARFVSNGLSFALFEHPNRNSAYKVYEVVNTRGRDLTPAELIKSYLISSVSRDSQRPVYDRWSALEAAFLDLDAVGQFTQFVRHTVTLSFGYVIPRDLYQAITEQYVGASGVELLLCDLEEHLDSYLQFVDPSDDGALADDTVASSFAILNMLGLRTVRPIFLAAAESDEPTLALQKLVRIVVTRLAVGAFGTGSVERRFADGAHRIHQGERWGDVLGELWQELAPRRATFQTKIADAALPKGLLNVLRNSIIQRSALPRLVGHLHQVRPRNAEQWPAFTDADYRAIGGTIGNSILLESERRPRNTHTLQGANERLFPAMCDGEDLILPDSIRGTFPAVEVKMLNEHLAYLATAVWYD